MTQTGPQPHTRERNSPTYASIQLRRLCASDAPCTAGSAPQPLKQPAQRCADSPTRPQAAASQHLAGARTR